LTLERLVDFFDYLSLVNRFDIEVRDSNQLFLPTQLPYKDLVRREDMYFPRNMQSVFRYASHVGFSSIMVQNGGYL
jgi:hypothetical protein